MQQHGERSWLFPPLLNSLSDLSTYLRGVHSVEVWDKDSGDLVAGEIGYSVGSIYTSMTGFYSKSGCGTIQMAVLGKLLEKEGFKVWDLGMSMPYKIDLGARTIERCEWISLLRSCRNDKSVSLCLEGRLDAKQLLV
jgi:Leu/Phe-tRNA-protein transferase